MKYLKRIVLSFLGLVVVLFIAANLLLAFKAKELLQRVVAEASNDTYRLESSKVNFFFINPGISADSVRIVPANAGPRQATISFARVEIRINSILALLFRKQLVVRKIEFVSPDITVYARQRSGIEKKGIAQTIHEVQSKLLQVLHSLNVTNFNLSDGALTLYTADTVANTYLGVNHINLVLQDIELSQSPESKRLLSNVDGYLQLNNPKIHLPSENSAVEIGQLKADLSTRSLYIDSLKLVTGLEKNDPQKVKLSSLDLIGFNWDKFLSTGIIELDSLIVNHGEADINLQKSKSAENSDRAKTYQGSSFVIHHTFISDISYNLESVRKSGSESISLYMQLKGDSLRLENLSIIHGRSPAFDVDQLNVSITRLQERDAKNRQHISLAGLTIDNHNLVMRKYLLETDKANANRNYFRISIPKFELNNYSLEELLQRQLAATSMTLYQPDIMVDIRQIKPKEETAKRDINESITGVMQSVSKKVKLGEIAIKDGDFVLLPTLDPKDQVKLTGLSMIIDAAKLPAVRSAMDLVHAIKTLNTTGFTVVGKGIKLEVQDMQLRNNPRGIYFGTIKGEFGEGRIVDLKGVTVYNRNLAFDPTQEGGLHLSDLLVDSGVVTVKKEVHHKKGDKPKTAAPAIMVDNLDLNNIKFKLNDSNQVGVSASLNISAADFAFRDNKAYWESLNITASKADATIDKTSFGAASMTIDQPGRISIFSPNGHTIFAGGKMDFEAEALQMQVGIQSSAISSLKVESITLVKPYLQLQLTKQAKTLPPAASKADQSFSDISLDRLELIQPAIEFSMKDSSGTLVQKHKTYTGTFILEQLKTLDAKGKPLITAARASYQTDSANLQANGKSLHPSALGIGASRFAFNPNSKVLQFHIDSAYIKNISQTIIGKKEDTVDLSISDLGIRDYPFNLKDSVEWRKLIHAVRWWSNGVNVAYKTPRQIIKASQVYAYGNKTISFGLDSFSITNRKSREEVWAATPYEKGYETISGGCIKASGIQLAFPEKKPQVSVEKLISSDLHFTTAKDKTKLEDTVDYRPLLTQTLLKIPIPMFIDSLLLQNAKVYAHEISKKTKKETSIYFTEINGYLQNVKNLNIKPEDTLDMRVRARFYGTDVVRLHFRQSYYDTLQEFWMRVRMSHFEMPEMNKLLVPLMGLNIHSGTVDSLLLVARGNDYFAYGTMDMRYHNLRARLLKTEDTKGKVWVSMANFLTGIFLRKHDNGRTDLLFKERIRKRSIFNFWGKIALEGLLTNLGVKRDKKERKQFEKTVKAFDLSENYWQDDDN